MAKQVARALGGQLSQPTLWWPSTGGRRQPRVTLGCGGRRGFFLAVGTASGHRWWPWRCQRQKGGGARAAGQHMGGVGEMAWSLCRLGPGRTRGAHERTRGLSGPTHFGPKSEIGMGPRGRLRTALSVWVIPLGRVFCPRERVRTRGGRLRRPTGDALKEDLVI
jgi:hypothetical protein